MSDETTDARALAERMVGDDNGYNVVRREDAITLARAYLAAEQRAEALTDVLSGLSMYVSTGMGDDTRTPEQWDERIRWGIDFLVDATAKRAEAAEQRVAEAERARDAFAPYLKEGETPIQRLTRERADNVTLLGELAKAKTRAEAAEADRAALREECREWERRACDAKRHKVEAQQEAAALRGHRQGAVQTREGRRDAMNEVPFDDDFVKALMDIDGVHGVGTSDNDTVLHIYASKTRKVSQFMRVTFPEGINKWVVHRCAAPKPAVPHA